VNRTMTKELRKKLGAISKRNWQKPGRKEKQSARAKAMWSNPTFKKRMGQLSKERWKNPIFREKTLLNSGFNNKGKEHPAFLNGSGRGYNYADVLRSIKLLGKNCATCGAEKNVYTHHKDGNAYNNPTDGSNWQRLCRSCHTKLHWKTRERLKPGEERLYKNTWDLLLSVNTEN